MIARNKRTIWNWLSIVMVLAVVLAGCQQPAATAPTAAEAETPSAQEAPAANAADSKESPMLAELVAAGKLPPLEERLPKDVLVIKPEANIGKYGGTLRGPHAWDVFFEQGLLQRIYTDRNTFVPQVAKDFKWADDFTSITFFLREGMKWSDGEPYTADDILFWWNDVVQSKYNATPYAVAGLNPETDKLVKVDDHTVRFDFAEPRPSFLTQSRGAWSYGFYGYPAHYFKTLHPDYNGTAADKAQEEFQKLLDILQGNQWIIKDPNAPTINAWKVKEYKQGEYVLFERNPYYFGVDPDGHQLPYIDYIEGLDKYDQDAELLKAKMLAGEADVLFRIVRPSDYPLFKEKEQSLGQQVLMLTDTVNGKQVFRFNQDYTGDAAVADLLKNVDFRRAMSLALDRDLMNESIFLGLGKPGHGFGDPGEFDEAIDTAYAVRDVDKANAMLDSIGLTNRDGDGLRTLPDGSPLTIDLLFRSGWGIGGDDIVSIAVDNWREIGLRVNARSGESRLYNELVTAKDWQLRLSNGVGGWTGNWINGLALDQFAPDEWAWMMSSTEAERRGTEPQGKLKELADLQQAAYQATDSAEAAANFQKYRVVMADQLFNMGTVANVPVILILNGNLRNVPGQTAPAAISQGESEYLRFEQWYFDK